MTATLTPIRPYLSADDWEISLHLHPDPRVPRICRSSAACALASYGLGCLSDAAELVTSELATNAVRHGRGPLVFRVAWYAARQRLRLTLWDEGSGRAPVIPALPGDLAEHGRGLHLVSRTADDWGQYATPGGGKAIWAELSVP